MKDDQQLAHNRKIFRALFGAIWILCIPPLGLYAWARVTGALPAQQVWEGRGGNHGPWWSEPEGFFIGLANVGMMVLPLITLVFTLAMVLELKKHKLATCLIGVMLAIFQGLVGFTVFSRIFWTID